MLGALKPTDDLFDVVKAMFKKAWDQQDKHAASAQKTAKQKIAAADKQIDQLLDRIMEASHPTVVAKYEPKASEAKNASQKWSRRPAKLKGEAHHDRKPTASPKTAKSAFIARHLPWMCLNTPYHSLNGTSAKLKPP